MPFRYHWKDVKDSLGKSRSMRSIAVLSIVTETGIAYAALMVRTCISAIRRISC